VIEVEVHQHLRAFLREQGEPYWPHHLTMGRLVARALRIERSVLIQTGVPATGYHGRYRLSYLLPVLMWSGPAVIVATEAVQQRLLMVEIPQLRQWMPIAKPVQVGDRFPKSTFQGILLTTPAAWLSDRLFQQGRFPPHIPTIIDGVDDLETWTHQQLTAEIHPGDWDALMLSCPQQADQIRDLRVQLTQALFQHPINPYESYLLNEPEQAILEQLLRSTSTQVPASSCNLPIAWVNFWHQFQAESPLLWAAILRRQGYFSLSCSPVDVASMLESVWSQQPVVLIGSALDLEQEAPIYRQRLGLGDLTCLKFSPDRHSETIQLYLPDGLPLPNTPQFQPALLREIQSLLNRGLGQGTVAQGLSVVLIGDVPLKAQVGAILAAEFGSRVQVEKTCLDDNGILVAGWEFWQQQQGVLPTPQLLVIATLPIPSLENPLVAGRVAYYKHLRQDWFRLYLLPESLSRLQRAIGPLRDSQGIVAVLDSRIIHRSYGQQVLSALSPLARVNYLDLSLP